MFSWFSFLTYVVITAATPGPNNLMSMSNAMKKGFRRAVPFNLGMWAGFTMVMLLCTVFCSLLSSLLPSIKMPMLVLGAVYMLFLAWKTLTGSAEMSGDTVKNSMGTGFALQFVNPKIIIYGIVSMEAYILPHFAGRVPVLIGFAVLLAFIGFLFSLCWTAFGSLFMKLFSQYAKVTNVVMALLLVYCAVSLFV